ncbi:MAG: 2,3-bisphosphoglycerate-independent phosphoglycerate mutase [Candidatus Nomurabacteria bacterium]|nr:MAG: 2,3-bisphosphoglycerate-independent phosphoglycerate mutase [Candidatus Nomurabacteria bacterium]
MATKKGTSTKTSREAHLWPAVLLVIDGFGHAPAGPGNAVTLAKTPNLTKIMKENPWTLLDASGPAVGLPPGQAGNSEAGHMNIGAGRVVLQDSVHITKEIEDGRFFKNAAFLDAIHHCQKRNSRVHLMGLLSNEQSGHSNPGHLQALLKLMRQKKVKEVYLHLFTDGRDTPPRSGLGMLHKLEKTLRPNERVVSIAGRLWAMDRKKNWQRTDASYHMLIEGQGHQVKSASEAISQGYAHGTTDEFIEPSVIFEKDKPVGRIEDGDAVIYFNLRSDRARQLTKPFVQDNFKEFRRRKVMHDLAFVAMTDFGPDLNHLLTAYPSVDIQGTLPMALKGKRQMYIAENEKFAHVTYFLNGGYANPVANEDRIMIPSPAVAHYDEVPGMSTPGITLRTLSVLQKKQYDFIGMNFANCDMVGHTGNLKAAITAVETVDEAIGTLYKEIQKQDGLLFITADHGNVESMLFPETGEADTEHSQNPVPFIIAGKVPKQFNILKKDGVLGQVAPTVLDTLGIPIPTEMKLSSLWQK